MAFLTKQVFLPGIILHAPTFHKVYPSNQCSEQTGNFTENISNDATYHLAAAVLVMP